MAGLNNRSNIKRDALNRPTDFAHKCRSVESKEEKRGLVRPQINKENEKQKLSRK